MRTAFLAVLLTAVPAFAADHTDKLDPTKTHQTIEHLGASDAWSIQIAGNWSDANRSKIADLLFSQDKGIGLSLWRFNLGAGRQSETIKDPLRSAETFEISKGRYDWNKQKPEQWFLAAAKQRGVEHFLAFCNSPPLRLTKNNLSNSGSDHTSSTNLKEGAEADFAIYLADILQHFRDEVKIPFDYISPFNEIQTPWNGGQEGCRIDNLSLKKALLALHSELKKRNLNTQILTPECSNAGDMLRPANGPTTRYSAPFGDYINFLTTDPELQPVLNKTLCHHIYGSETSPNLERWSQRLGDRMKQLPDWKIWMSEICILQNKRDLSIDSGLNVAKIIHHVFATEGATAFHWWLAFSPYDYKDGLVYTDWKKPGDPESVLESKMLWAMGNYSRFLRPGSKRIDLTPPTPPSTRPSENTLLRSAYLAPNGNLIAIYLNFSTAEERVKLTLPSEYTTVTPYLTDPTHNLEAQPSLPATDWQTLPPRSATTFVISK